MTTQHREVQVMTHVMAEAVSYYIPKDQWLTGTIRPHVYKGWHAYWQAKAPNGQNMSAIVSGPYETREEEALASLYNTPDQILDHKKAVKANRP